MQRPQRKSITFTPRNQREQHTKGKMENKGLSLGTIKFKEYLGLFLAMEVRMLHSIIQKLR